MQFGQHSLHQGIKKYQFRRIQLIHFQKEAQIIRGQVFVIRARKHDSRIAEN